MKHVTLQEVLKYSSHLRHHPSSFKKVAVSYDVPSSQIRKMSAYHPLRPIITLHNLLDFFYVNVTFASSLLRKIVIIAYPTNSHTRITTKHKPTTHASHQQNLRISASPFVFTTRRPTDQPNATL